MIGVAYERPLAIYTKLRVEIERTKLKGA
jgi:hypothetical protein